MNLDEYRALKAKTDKQEEIQENEPEVTKETEQKEDTPEQTKEDEVVALEIDGETLTIDQIKEGYMRQSDYTRKTQTLKQREQQAQEAVEFVEQLQGNPNVIEILSKDYKVPKIDRKADAYKQLENDYNDLLIKTEIQQLQQRYGEFDVEEVLRTAAEGKLEDLDTAYHIVRSRKGETVDEETLRKKLRDELLEELTAQNEATVNTGSVIGKGGGGTPPTNTGPEVSNQEVRVAKAMGMSPKEYATWRDGSKK